MLGHELDTRHAHAALPPPRRLWPWALLLLPLTAAGYFLWRGRQADAESIREQRERSAGEQAEIVARPRGRAALVEPATPGEATAVVAAFLEAVQALPEAVRAVVEDHVRGDDDATPELAALVAEHHEPILRLEPLLTVWSTPPPPQFGSVEAGADIERFMPGTRWIELAADVAILGGAAERALELALLEIAYGSEVAWGGHQVHDLTGAGIHKRGIRHLAAALAMAPVDAATARRARHALERLELARIPAADVVAIECASLRLLLLDPGTSWDQTEDDYFRRPTLEALDGARDDLLAALAEEDAVATIRRVQELAAGPAPALLKMVMVVFPIWAAERANVVAWLRVARTALAVAEFVALEGVPPATLEALVPGLLPSAPVDPWSGTPLRYRPGAVWSIGRNGTDQGGVPPEDAEKDWDDDYMIVVPVR